MYIPKRIQDAYNEYNIFYFMNEQECVELDNETEKLIEYINTQEAKKLEQEKRKVIQEEKEKQEKLEKTFIEIFGEDYEIIFA